MILSFLLLLGPIIGAFLIWNSPEEVQPGHVWFLHLMRIFFVLGTGWMALSAPLWAIAIPIILFMTIELSKRFFGYVLVLWIAATYKPHWSAILVCMLVSTLYLAFVSEKDVTPESADMKNVFLHARVFVWPFLLSVLFSFVA